MFSHWLHLVGRAMRCKLTNTVNCDNVFQSSIARQLPTFCWRIEFILANDNIGLHSKSSVTRKVLILILNAQTALVFDLMNRNAIMRNIFRRDAVL